MRREGTDERRVKLERRADGTSLLTRAEALHTGDALLGLQVHALDAVVALVPANAATFFSVGRRRTIERAVSYAQAGAEALDGGFLAEAVLSGPLAPWLLEPSDTTVLALDQAAVRAPGYVAALREAGWRDQLAMYFRSAGTTVGVVSLLRAGGESRFAAADVLRLRRVHPLLEHVYASAIEPGRGSPLEALRGSGLSRREADVAQLIGRGASNAEIARSLHVTEATVKSHLTRIYTKVGVRTRTQLALVVGGWT